jgi:hypothetical protein
MAGDRRPAPQSKETTMNVPNEHLAAPRLATSLRVTTIVVVVGTLLAIWHPAKHDSTASPETTAASVAVSAPAAGKPDMSVYFPGQFPAPTGPRTSRNHRRSSVQATKRRSMPTAR